MKKLKRFSLTLAALLLLSGLAMVNPALAHDGSSDSTTSSSSTDSSSDNTTDQVEVHNLTSRFKQEAENEIEAHKATLKQHSEQERQKSCDARKNSLTRRMNNAVSQAKRHKAVFDKIYSKVKAFHDSKQLNVPNYDSLTAAVDTAQANAQVSIDALTALNVNVDCTSQTVATTVSTFQQAVKSTRDSLKAYRASIVDLIKALKGASTSSTNSSETENSTTNTTGQ